MFWWFAKSYIGDLAYIRVLQHNKVGDAGGCLSNLSEKHPQTQTQMKGQAALLCTCDFPENTVDGNNSERIFQDNLILFSLFEICVFWLGDLVCWYWFLQL